MKIWVRGRVHGPGENLGSRVFRVHLVYDFQRVKPVSGRPPKLANPGSQDRPRTQIFIGPLKEQLLDSYQASYFEKVRRSRARTWIAPQWALLNMNSLWLTFRGVMIFTGAICAGRSCACAAA